MTREKIVSILVRLKPDEAYIWPDGGLTGCWFVRDPDYPQRFRTRVVAQWELVKWVSAGALVKRRVDMHNRLLTIYQLPDAPLPAGATAIRSV